MYDLLSASNCAASDFYNPHLHHVWNNSRSTTSNTGNTEYVREKEFGHVNPAIYRSGRQHESFNTFVEGSTVKMKVTCLKSLGAAHDPLVFLRGCICSSVPLHFSFYPAMHDTRCGHTVSGLITEMQCTSDKAFAECYFIIKLHCTCID